MSTVNRQYQEPTVPKTGTPAEVKKFAQQVNAVLEDIYYRYGRMTLSDLAQNTRNAIKDGSVLTDGALSGSKLQSGTITSDKIKGGGIDYTSLNPDIGQKLDLTSNQAIEFVYSRAKSYADQTSAAANECAHLRAIRLALRGQEFFRARAERDA